MRIIIGGAGGQIGFYLAKRLSSEKHNLTLIDDDEERCAQAQSMLDVAVLQGDVSRQSVLREAGVKSADIFIAVTASDEVNILTCLIASRMGARCRIARVRNTQYFDSSSPLTAADMGIDLCIQPEEEAVSKIVRLLMRAAASDIVELENGRVLLLGLKPDASCRYLDKSLREFGGEEEQKSFRFVAILRDGRTLIPSGSDTIRRNDEVFLIMKKESLSSVLRLAGKTEERFSKVVILGAGPVGGNLSAQLERMGKHVALLDPDREQSQRIAEELDGIMVIQAEEGDLDVFAAPELQDADALVAVTPNEEANILSCLLAKRRGIHKTIAMVNRESYLPMLPSVGIDSTVNVRIATANAILSFIRRGELRSVATLADIDAEVLEFEIASSTRITGKPLSGLKIPEGSIIASIMRDGEVQIPSGDSTLEIGDRVVVFALPRAGAILRKLFQK